MVPTVDLKLNKNNKIIQPTYQNSFILQDKLYITEPSNALIYSKAVLQ